MTLRPSHCAHRGGEQCLACPVDRCLAGDTPDPMVQPLLENLATTVERFFDWPPSGAKADRIEALALADAAREVVAEYRAAQHSYRMHLAMTITDEQLRAAMNYRSAEASQEPVIEHRDVTCPKCGHSGIVSATVVYASCSKCDTSFPVAPERFPARTVTDALDHEFEPMAGDDVCMYVDGYGRRCMKFGGEHRRG